MSVVISNNQLISIALILKEEIKDPKTSLADIDQNFLTLSALFDLNQDSRQDFFVICAL